MTDLISRSRRTTRHLLLGSASAAMIATLAFAPAHATDVMAAGRRTLVSQQTSIDAATRASASNPVIKTTAGSTDASSIAVSDNIVSATARGNKASNSLAPDALDLTSVFGATRLTTGSDRVEADSAAVIANVQTSSASPVRADTLGSKISLGGGTVTNSKLAVDANSQEAVALANDASSNLALTGVAVDAGAGIASYQATDSLSPVSASFRGRAGLATNNVAASDLALTNNLQRAIGYGNSADNSLSVKAVSLDVPSSHGLSSVVPAEGNGQPVVKAAYAVLSHQELGGDVAASASANTGYVPAFGVTVAGDLARSTVKDDGNALVAAGYGNQSTNAASLDAVSITRAGWGHHALVADVTNVQRIGDADVRAATNGGTVARVNRDVSDSSLSATGNTARTIATGNLAAGNLLAVKANSIDVLGDSGGYGDGGHGGGDHGGGGLGGGVIGTALLSYDDTLSASAAFSVQNAQDYGSGPISASQRTSDVAVVVGRDISRSALKADGNAALLAATGNSAVNGLTLEATSLRTSADVNSLQTGTGDVLASIGTAQDRAGAGIAIRGGVQETTLSIAGNGIAGTAIGDSVSNSLAASADIIADGSGHHDALAGSLLRGTGAAADYALANTQRLGADYGSEGGSAVQIRSTVDGRFAIKTGGAVDRSALTVENNSQVANALGNTAANRAAISATSLTGDAARAAGSALSSIQLGNADVRAASNLQIAAPGDVMDSSVSLAKNSNQALAVVNDVNNGLIVDAVRIGALTGGDAFASTGSYGPASISGDHVLNTIQAATGSAGAVATTTIGNSVSGASLAASRFTAADNVTSADASANRALNAVSVTAASGREANAGLANSQYSDAGVTASATTDAHYAGSGTDASSLTVDGNSTTATARGNAADNRLALTGGSGLAVPFTPGTMSNWSGSAVHASAVLLNGQTNEGAVTARSVNVSYGVALNGYGADASSVGVTGNGVSAGATGNTAVNVITLASLDHLPTAAIMNVQANYGPVTAQVVGATYRTISGPISASALILSGNQVSATATGNTATNAIASPR